MQKKSISLHPLQKALKSLESAVQQPLNEYTRDSVIQRFEYTFELCWKMLQKVMESDKPLEDLSVRGILRDAAKQHLIENLELWFKFQESRNMTSHTYNEATAEEVYQVAITLPGAASELIKTLRKQING